MSKTDKKKSFADKQSDIKLSEELKNQNLTLHKLLYNIEKAKNVKLKNKNNN